MTTTPTTTPAAPAVPATPVRTSLPTPAAPPPAAKLRPSSISLPQALKEVTVISAVVSGAGATLTATLHEFGNAQVNADVTIALAVLAGLLLAAREAISALVNSGKVAA